MFRFIIAFFQALLAFIGFGIIALILYSDLEAPYNLIVPIGVVIFGLFASRSVFGMIQRRGVLEVMAGDNSSYELDELEPTTGSGIVKLSPQELVEQFKVGKVKFSYGITVAIWGDSKDRKLGNKHLIRSIEFNTLNDTLKLIFTDNCQLEIEKPIRIYCTSTYLKIVKASAIHWQIPIGTTVFYTYSYLNTGIKIETTSNTKWRPHKYDLGIGMNALYLQG